MGCLSGDGGASVAQLRIPVRTAADRGEIKQIPQWPDEVDVTTILARLVRSEQQLRVVRMVDLSIALHKDIQRWHLIWGPGHFTGFPTIGGCDLAVVIVIVSVIGR